MPNDAPANPGSQREQGIGSSITFHAALSYLILLLSTLIQVKYQSKDASPFETHPATMLAFLVVVVIHVAALMFMIGLETNDTSYLPALRHALLISGALASALLLLILVPLFGWIVFTFCAFLIVAIARVWYREIFKLLVWAASEVFNKLRDWFWQFFQLLHKVVLQAFNKSPTSRNSTEIEVRPPV